MIREGESVRVRGLLKNQEHNGRLGVVLRYVESKERYLVEMESGKKLQVRERNLSSVANEVIIKAICVAKMANQSAKQCDVMANQAVVKATIVRASIHARLAADYANAVTLSLDIEFKKELKKRRTKKTWAMINASNAALNAAVFAESIVRNISISHVKRRVRFSEERRVHELKRFHHTNVNQAARDHRERMKRDQHKHHHHHRSTRGKKSTKCSGDRARMKNDKIHDLEHAKKREDAQRRRKRAAKEKNRKKKEKSSAASAAAELRLEMACNAIANAVRVSIASSSSAFLAVENADNAARNALEKINRNAARVAKSSARAAQTFSRKAIEVVRKGNAIRDAIDVTIRAAMSATNVCMNLENIVREAAANRPPPEVLLDEKQILNNEVVHLDPRIFALHREILHQQREQCARIAKAFETCVAPENHELASALIRWYQDITKATQTGEFVEKMLMGSDEMDPVLPPKVEDIERDHKSENVQRKIDSEKVQKKNKKNKKKSWKKKNYQKKKKEDGGSTQRKHSKNSTSRKKQQPSKNNNMRRKFKKKKKTAVAVPSSS